MFVKDKVALVIGGASGIGLCCVTELLENSKGTVNGCLLAMDEYILKYRSTPEGVVVNVSSIFGIQPCGGIPVYISTKHAIVGLSRSLVEPPLNKDNIKILTICPGVTNTALLDDVRNKTPHNSLEKYQLTLDEWKDNKMEGMQEANFVAENVVRLIAEANSGTIWNLEKNQIYEVIIPEKKDPRRK